MTIAATFLSTEGVVFGADSTSTVPIRREDGSMSFAYYNHAQKIFQVGRSETTLGVALWGLNGFVDRSFRTLIADFADENLGQPTTTLEEVAQRFADYFWRFYESHYRSEIDELRGMTALGEVSEEEANHFLTVFNRSSGGFFFGGNLYHDRTPQVFEIRYDPIRLTPDVTRLQVGEVRFRGLPNAFNRLTVGIDPNLAEEILESGLWMGGKDRLNEIIRKYTWMPPELPIRDALDWVHASVYSTIKSMKFSSQPPSCGGPVELAVITTDRPFRWVEHKKLNVAIGGYSDG